MRIGDADGGRVSEDEICDGAVVGPGDRGVWKKGDAGDWDADCAAVGGWAGDAGDEECLSPLPLEGEQCLVVTSANMRSPGQEWEKFLFNQFSFLMFTAECGEMATAGEMAGKMRDQF